MPKMEIPSWMAIPGMSSGALTAAETAPPSKGQAPTAEAGWMPGMQDIPKMEMPNIEMPKMEMFNIKMPKMEIPSWMAIPGISPAAESSPRVVCEAELMARVNTVLTRVPSAGTPSLSRVSSTGSGRGTHTHTHTVTHWKRQRCVFVHVSQSPGPEAPAMYICMRYMYTYIHTS